MSPAPSPADITSDCSQVIQLLNSLSALCVQGVDAHSPGITPWADPVSNTYFLIVGICGPTVFPSCTNTNASNCPCSLSTCAPEVQLEA